MVIARDTLRGLFLCSVMLLALASNAQSSECDKSNYRIVIDTGHSVVAPGALSANGLTEYEYNIRLASIIEGRLRAKGYWQVYRYVAPGGGDTLTGRAAWANSHKPNLFLSVHHDSVQPMYLEPWIVNGRQQLYSDRFKGWSLFVSNTNSHPDRSLRFARSLADQLLARSLPFTTHHSEQVQGEGRLFLDPARGIYRDDRLTVLRLTHSPAVLLEAGVIVNREEEAALSLPGRQNLIADAVVTAVNVFCSTE